MGQLTDWPKEAIDSKAMAMLQDLLQEWCAKHACLQTSADGQSRARELIEWFEFGIQDPAELRSMIHSLPTRSARFGGTDHRRA